MKYSLTARDDTSPLAFRRRTELLAQATFKMEPMVLPCRVGYVQLRNLHAEPLGDSRRLGWTVTSFG